jgi:hypothetical protein
MDGYRCDVRGPDVDSGMVERSKVLNSDVGNEDSTTVERSKVVDTDVQGNEDRTRTTRERRLCDSFVSRQRVVQTACRRPSMCDGMQRGSGFSGQAAFEGAGRGEDTRLGLGHERVVCGGPA